VRTLVASQTSNQDDVKLTWDGHDEDGLLVNNGTYDYRVTAVDAAGNVSAACTNSVTVNSVLDPADFK
jgi:flagellar hook assembly protein FlgD